MACQTEAVFQQAIPQPPPMTSVGVCTNDIECRLTVLGDHSYSADNLVDGHGRYRPDSSIGRPQEVCNDIMDICQDFVVSDDEMVQVDGVITEHVVTPDSAPAKSTDPDYSPCDEDNCSTDSEDEADHTQSTSCPTSEDKFLIFKSRLLELFKVCHLAGCGKPLCEEAELRTSGSALTVRTECIDGHKYSWDSQPKVKNVYAGNLLIPAALFVTGGSYTSFAEFCSAMNLQSLSVRECDNLQSTYIIPEVTAMWSQHLEALVAASVGQPLVLCGDARCDSPGYSATFGTYTLFDAENNTILAQETVRVDEVKNSYWLEPEGLQRCLSYLEVCFIYAKRTHACILLATKHVECTCI